jgi:hypothetical protein
VTRTRAVRSLLPVLEGEDAFARLEAERRLGELARRDFGYRWDAPDPSRALALGRVRAWIREETERAGRVRGPAGGDVRKMTPGQLQEHLQALLAGAVRPACSGCAKAPATVEIVRVAGRSGRVQARLCEPCAAARGFVRG